jgi:isoleucyl-tRNA synthetase
LEANVKVYSDYVDGLRQFDLEELAIVSKVELVESSEMKVEVSKAEGNKCERCWRLSESTTKRPTKYGDVILCDRCLNVVTNES